MHWAYEHHEFSPGVGICGLLHDQRQQEPDLAAARGGEHIGLEAILIELAQPQIVW
jgi:hypothetical protein